MRPTLSILTICAALVLTFAGCSQNGTEPEKHGTIDCRSFPPGAAIWLDGTDTGLVTDAALTGVDYGDHVVTFTIHGYYAHAETVVVSASVNPAVYHSFSEHRPAVLRLLSNPPEAYITLNDSLLSVMTPAIIPDVPLGFDDKCEVYLRRPGYYPHFETVALSGEDTTTVSATFEPCPDIMLTQVRGDKLFLIRADGIEWSVLASGLSNLGLYRVSPNGQYVAYTSANNSIVIANRDGSIRTEIPNPHASDDYVWSNSGDRLAFGAYVDGIYLYDAPSNVVRRIYQTQGFVYDHNPTFSPGDSLIAFVNHSYGTQAIIRVMRVDGSGVHTVYMRISTLQNASLQLCWVAPDAVLWADFYGIYWVDPLSGTGGKVVATANLTSVAYSPDRTRYAFAESGDQRGLYLGTVGLWDRRRLPDTYAGSPLWLPGNNCLQYWGDGHLKLAFWDGATHIIAP